MKREMICIVCPKGCALTVEYDGQDVHSVTGNTCKRGEAYAVAECLHPERTVTSTMRAVDGSVIPVKTDRPLPKEKMFDCMALIDSITVQSPVKVGQVLAANILGTDVNIVAAKTL